MSAKNGTRIIKIDRKGKMLFALGDGEPFEVDVVDVYEQWREIDRGFRDAEGKLLDGQGPAMNAALLQFTREFSNTPDVNLAEALEFRKRITDEVNDLADFFVPKTKGEPSSPESSATRFST